MADDLDNILDDALDAIGSDEDEKVKTEQNSEHADLQAAVKKAATESAATAEESAAAAAKNAGTESLEESMAKLLKDMQNPEFEETLNQAMKLFGNDGNLDPTKAMENLFGGSGEGASGGQMTDSFKELAKQLEGADPAQAEQLGEKLMAEMMGQFEQMSMKEDFAETMEKMMRQLISKDVMYTPMKQVCDKFPEWLADNESKLPKEEYERYGKQYQYFQQIIAIYDNEPENQDRVMELMQEMQEYGQPPAEIIKELAPGLELDADGMPKLGDLGGFPGALGADGKPPNCPQM